MDANPTTSLADRLAAYDTNPVPKTLEHTGPSLAVRTMAQVETKTVEWLWPGWLPKGMLTILGGYAGDGKSTLSLALAAMFSCGGTLPDGSTAPQTTSMLLLAEDDASFVVKNRLELHGLDPNRVITLDGVRSADDGVRGINLRTDVPLLRQSIEQHGVGLLIIDPLTSFLSASDRNSEGDVRDTLAPLIQMIADTKVAVIGIMHIGKSDTHQRAMQRLLGSTAFTALARSVWMVHPMPDDMQVEGEPTRKVVGVTKSNYSIPPAPLMFSRPLDGALQFHGQSSMGLEDVITWRKPREQETGSPERDKAKDFLYRYLAGGMKRPTEIERAAHAEGITKRILRRAKEDMNVQSIKVKDAWFWSLPTNT